MKAATGAIFLAAAAVLFSLALVYVLVRTDLVDAALWSFYPVIMAVCLAIVFTFSFLRRKRASKGNEGARSSP